MQVKVTINKTYDVLDFYDQDDLEDYTIEDFKSFLLDLFFDDAAELAENVILEEVKDEN